MDAPHRHWAAFLHAWLQWWISFDQLANNTLSLLFPGAWAGSWADETLSSRSYRAWRDGKLMGRITMPFIDRVLFFWQSIPPGFIGHCHWAYVKEGQRYNSPPEQRQ
jgi:hypothetical protein